PLVDGQGNFGNIDGYPAAAMRHTECRLSRIATEMLRDIDADTVNFGPNYDESRREPLVLPARVPNLLVNGSAGIAVGMATNIPPHHPGETIDALGAVTDDPAIDADLVKEDTLKEVADLKDLSDKSGMRIEIHLKRDVVPQVALNKLYKHTALQTTFGYNAVALVDGVPRTLGLRDLLFHYLEHQRVVVTRRLKFEL